MKLVPLGVTLTCISLLAGCGGGGGGGASSSTSTTVSYGPTPSTNQTLAQIQATSGQYIDSGGDGQSIRVADAGNDVAVNSGDRRVFGFRTTGTDDRFEVRVNTRIFPAVTLAAATAAAANQVRTTLAGDNLDLYSIGNQATATTGSTQSAIVGLWILDPDGATVRLMGGFRAGSFTDTTTMNAIDAANVSLTYTGTDSAIVQFESENVGETSFTALGDVNIRFDFNVAGTPLTGLLSNIDEIGAGNRQLENMTFTGNVSGQTWTANLTGLANPAVVSPNLQTLTAANVVNVATANTFSGAFYGPDATQTAGTFRINDGGTRYVTGAMLADRP
ncbi:transferrin-binding protein-like solute binding protein [Pontivivens insulae]|uniref:Transferrin-binding protein B C-lobe/N-lobe beta-barrel domain-containing protein n=1 Tax=Pontivivens insulae TaxID=1639689 RepID=A0A2R8AC52_9RHOB|nr:transferrin-binding protein-like solute binding protein [Pontivivens insulae]RED11024.1 hypothetical protein DFR53_3052 [Pontivivens insulae]SPF29801.1 hypothetical protein POI8812_02119 [Pontivivens insulae]